MSCGRNRDTNRFEIECFRSYAYTRRTLVDSFRFYAYGFVGLVKKSVRQNRIRPENRNDVDRSTSRRVIGFGQKLEEQDVAAFRRLFFFIFEMNSKTIGDELVAFRIIRVGHVFFSRVVRVPRYRTKVTSRFDDIFYFYFFFLLSSTTRSKPSLSDTGVLFLRRGAEIADMYFRTFSACRSPVILSTRSKRRLYSGSEITCRPK